MLLISPWYLSFSNSIILSRAPAPANYTFDYPLGGAYFRYSGRWLVIPYSSPIFSPPVLIESEITRHKPYLTIFRFFDRNGELIGNYTMKESFSAGYFYFKDGFLVYTVSPDGFNVSAFSYNLEHTYQLLVSPYYPGYYVILPLAAYADSRYAYFFTANEDDIRMRTANYCLTYIEFSTGKAIEVCNSKALKGEFILGAVVFRDRIYIATGRGIVLLGESGEIEGKTSIPLAGRVMMQADERYLALAYGSTLCVFTSALETGRCLNIGEKIEAFKLDEGYLILKAGREVMRFRITLKRVPNLKVTLANGLLKNLYLR